MMLSIAFGLLLIGVFLSAFFSGSETGFYRASRVRIVIAGLDGDRVSQYLIKLINNPTLFVATSLIGNNVANYLTSLAIVLITKSATTSSAADSRSPRRRSWPSSKSVPRRPWQVSAFASLVCHAVAS